MLDTLQGRLGWDLDLPPERVSISAPRSIHLIFLAVVLLRVDAVLIYFEAAAVLGAVGVLIEIAGAVLIAIPEINLLENYTRAGKLRHVYTMLSPGWGFSTLIHPGSVMPGTSNQKKGVIDLIDVFTSDTEEESSEASETESIVEVKEDWNNVNSISIEEEVPRVLDPKIEMNHLAPFLVIWSRDPGEITSVTPWIWAERKIQEEIRRQEGVFVRFGVILLAIGFSQQLISYIILAVV